MPAPHTEDSTMAACVARVVGAPDAEVPVDAEERRAWVVVRGVDLNGLVGREFTLGGVRCRGRRLYEPCAHLDRLNGGGVLRPLVHRGGLRADVLEDGTVRVGDRVAAV